MDHRDARGEALERVSKRPCALPDSLPPRGLSRIQAAQYIGVSPSHFDKMIQIGKMPPAKMRLGRRVVWDRKQLDRAFDELDADSSWTDDDAAEANTVDRLLQSNARQAKIHKRGRG